MILSRCYYKSSTLPLFWSSIKVTLIFLQVAPQEPPEKEKPPSEPLNPNPHQESLGTQHFYSKIYVTKFFATCNMLLKLCCSSLTIYQPVKIMTGPP